MAHAMRLLGALAALSAVVLRSAEPSHRVMGLADEVRRIVQQYDMLSCADEVRC